MLFPVGFLSSVLLERAFLPAGTALPPSPSQHHVWAGLLQAPAGQSLRLLWALSASARPRLPPRHPSSALHCTRDKTKLLDLHLSPLTPGPRPSLPNSGPRGLPRGLHEALPHTSLICTHPSSLSALSRKFLEAFGKSPIPLFHTSLLQSSLPAPPRCDHRPVAVIIAQSANAKGQGPGASVHSHVLGYQHGA